LLPDRHDFLQPVDRQLASAEGGAPVSRSNDNRHAGLTNFEPSQSVNHADVVNFKFSPGFATDLLHFAQGHRLVRLVLKVKSSAPTRMVPHDTLEDHHGAI